MAEDTRPLVYVVAGVVLNEAGDYLLSTRPEGKAYAGYWEFAGGKVEVGESEFAALQREFAEELGIEILRATPWLTKVHAYEHARVHLRFFRVAANDWRGELQSREGQSWSWQRAGDFDVSPMLPANGLLLEALAVPTALQGCLKTGLRGENRMGEFRVLPFEMAEPQHQNVLIEETKLRTMGRLPEGKKVWAIVDDMAQWQRVQDVDVVVWRVLNQAAAQVVEAVLYEGVAMPLVVYATPEWMVQYGESWRELGAHALVRADVADCVEAV